MQLVVSSKSSTTLFPLKSDGEWNIGRHPDNNITIDDPKASRRHGRLTAEDGILYFEDLGTGNGTLVSNVSIPPNTRIEIKEDDLIEIGEFQLQLETSDEATELPPETLPAGKTGILTLQGSESVFDLGDEPVLIGRLPVCQIEIDDPGSSRVNTEIILRKGK